MKKYQVCNIFLIIIVAFIACNKEKEVVKEYWPNGTIKTVYVYLNNDTSSYQKKEFFENGKAKSEVSYCKNLLNGNNLYFNNDGSKWGKDIFEKGELKFQRLYYPSGNLKSSETISRLDTITYDTLVNGITGFVKSVGDYIEWHENGKIKIRKNDFPDSSYIYKYWNEKGVFIKEEHYKKGYILFRKEYN